MKVASRPQPCDQVSPGACQLHPQHGAEAETGDRQTRDKPLLVRKPAHPHGDRDDIGQPDTGAADHAHAQKHRPKTGAAEQAGEQIARAEHDPARYRELPRSEPRHDPPGEYHHQGEGDQAGGKHVLGLGDAPAAVLQR